MKIIIEALAGWHYLFNDLMKMYNFSEEKHGLDDLAVVASGEAKYDSAQKWA